MDREDDGGGLFDAVFGSGGGSDWEPSHLLELEPSALEEAVVALYEAEGYDVERAGPTAEDGVDFLARESGLLRSSTTVLCVRGGRSVSPATVDLLERAREINGAGTAVLVRPEGFPDAVREAAAGRQVTLLDAGLLADRLDRTDLEPP